MDNLYPLSLYRRGSSFVWEGHSLDMLTVSNDDDHGRALSQGWVEISDILRNPMDADGAGKIGGSIDALDQKTDEDLRATAEERGLTLHHRAGRTKMLQLLRGSENV